MINKAVDVEIDLAERRGKYLTEDIVKQRDDNKPRRYTPRNSVNDTELRNHLKTIVSN